MTGLAHDPDPEIANAAKRALVKRRFGYNGRRLKGALVGDSEDDNVKAKVKVAVDEFLLGYDYELKRGLGLIRALKQFATGEDEELARMANKALHGDETVAAASKKAAAAEKKKAAVVAPDPARAPTETTSKFWGVNWDRRDKKWRAQYQDADGKRHTIGYFDDEEEAARAYNKAINEAGLEGRRKTNAVDATGALVPREHTIRRDRASRRRRRRPSSGA